ncbi:MAG TPA: methyltransferase domain-containing protein [Propionibacteriaceae bacterium]|nr:methyltransferase domain-containing protein [Propionibacteriaceae bacterium]
MRDPLGAAGRVLGRAGLVLLNHLPVPLALARLPMLGENAIENARGGWSRLRHESEAGRYRAVRAAVQRHAPGGFVLDVGCSQAILQEGLTYRRYVGVDRYAPALGRARGLGQANTEFVSADATTFVPDEPPDAVVFNEVLYYLPHPVRVVERYARLLSPSGVVVVSCYARTWPTRRLLRRLGRSLAVVESVEIVAEPHAWRVAVLRRRS